MQQKQSSKCKHLGLNIANYRKERGLSQSQLAELVNISRTHISRIESADCAISLDVVFDICDVLCIRHPGFLIFVINVPLIPSIYKNKPVRLNGSVSHIGVSGVHGSLGDRKGRPYAFFR